MTALAARAVVLGLAFAHLQHDRAEHPSPHHVHKTKHSQTTHHHSTKINLAKSSHHQAHRATHKTHLQAALEKVKEKHRKHKKPHKYHLENLETERDASSSSQQGSTSHLLMDMVQQFSLSCLTQQCGHMLESCAGSDKSCGKLVTCISKENEEHVSGCIKGMRLLDLDQTELKVMGCGETKGCIELWDHARQDQYDIPGATSFLQTEYAHDPSEDEAVFGKDKPDYAGLAKARDELRSLTSENKRKYDDLRREQTESKARMEADLDKESLPDVAQDQGDSSFLQSEPAPEGAEDSAADVAEAKAAAEEDQAADARIAAVDDKESTAAAEKAVTEEAANLAEASQSADDDAKQTRVQIGQMKDEQEAGVQDWVHDLAAADAPPSSLLQASSGELAADHRKTSPGQFLAELEQFGRKQDRVFAADAAQIESTFGTDPKAAVSSARQLSARLRHDHLREDQ